MLVLVEILLSFSKSTLKNVLKFSRFFSLVGGEQVTYGEDNLIRPKSASFKELLLNGGPSDGEED